MIKLSQNSGFVLRYRAALFVVALSFFFMAIALAGKVLGDTARLVDVLPFVLELVFGCIGVVFASRFGRDPYRFKIPVIALLVAAVAFHFWLMAFYVDFTNCPFGTIFCSTMFYGYLAILALMAVLLAMATPASSPPVN